MIWLATTGKFQKTLWSFLGDLLLLLVTSALCVVEPSPATYHLLAPAFIIYRQRNTFVRVFITRCFVLSIYILFKMSNSAAFIYLGDNVFWTCTDITKKLILKWNLNFTTEKSVWPLTCLATFPISACTANLLCFI